MDQALFPGHCGTAAGQCCRIKFVLDDLSVIHLAVQTNEGAYHHGVRDDDDTVHVTVTVQDAKYAVPHL